MARKKKRTPTIRRTDSFDACATTSNMLSSNSLPAVIVLNSLAGLENHPGHLCAEKDDAIRQVERLVSQGGTKSAKEEWNQTKFGAIGDCRSTSECRSKVRYIHFAAVTIMSIKKTGNFFKIWVFDLDRSIEWVYGCDICRVTVLICVGTMRRSLILRRRC